MMSDEGPPPQKRVRLSREDLENMPRQELLDRWAEREALIDSLMSRHHAGSDPISNDELCGMRESEEKMKQQQIEAMRRENVLVMRLTTKEQELQDCMNQIQELKQSHNPSSNQLRSMLLDPAVNLMFQRMKREMDACKEKLEQAQNDLAAWKFTPDSQTGKRLMAKCRMLLQENEELGKTISSGRIAKLEGEIALKKTLVQEMKKSQAEMDEFLVELDEDVEGMQSTIYLLQQQLKDAKVQIASLQEENAALRTAQENVNKRAQQEKVKHASSFQKQDTTVLRPSQENATKRMSPLEGNIFKGTKQEKIRTPSPCSPATDSAPRTPGEAELRQASPSHTEQRTHTPNRDLTANLVSTNSSDGPTSPPQHPSHASNGDNMVVTTETDSSDSQAESEEDRAKMAPAHQTLKSTKINSNHGNNSHPADHSMSDGAYVTENTDQTSSDTDIDERTDARTDPKLLGPDPSRLQNGLADPLSQDNTSYEERT